MKKTFLYMCLAAVLAVVFSSCLGDNESTTSDSKAFTVIKENAGVLYAVIYINNYGVGYITGDGLTGVEAGDAARISYKVNLNYVGGTNIAKADYIAVDEVYPKSAQKVVKEQAMDTIVNNSPFKSVSVGFYDSYMFFSNKWLFNLSAEVMGDQNFDVIFSYDKSADSQKDKDGKALDANTVIVDVTLVKTGVAGEGATVKTKSKSVVVDFTSFRTLQTPQTIPTEGVAVNVWFRHIYMNPSTKKKEVNYLNQGARLIYFKS